jgi:hypothetical protein
MPGQHQGWPSRSPLLREQLAQRRLVHVNDQTSWEWSVLAPLLVLGVGAFAYLLTYTFYGRHIPVDADGQGVLRLPARLPSRS